MGRAKFLSLVARRGIVSFLGIRKVKPKNLVGIRTDEEPKTNREKVIGDVCSRLNIQRAPKPKSLVVSLFENKQETYPPIEEVQRFHFNRYKYPVTQDELDAVPGLIPCSPIGVVTPNTPYIQSLQELKGVQSNLYSLAIETRMTTRRPIYKCEFFTLSFYPESSFVGRIRKSKPAILFSFDQTSLFNNPDAMAQLKGCNIGIDTVKFHPFSLSVHRTKTTKFYRKTFFKYCMENNMREKYDGVYKFHLFIRPVTTADFVRLDRCIAEALQSLRGHKGPFEPDPKGRLDERRISAVCKTYGLPPLK
ncbi:hypothetical protein OGAPHI_001414 [Ogataea philodendri]|uniref:Uncharacterized protein n=1 Tax=Ogataea philodendri TaxID=1378263 RepID=A0A9P8PBN2_9ASCO|nr:uncharacterized protein OGAPHI_001414 [Ogataea philodendri]KAH3669293.1 hypothetical protein OGAPHI_001414 [Ogataea philodendri]